MDILAGLRIAIDTFWYNLILSLAGLHWSLLRGLLMMGYTVDLVNRWLLDNAFAPLIAQTNASLSAAVSLAFVIAMLVLGLTYLLAAFIRLEVVNFRSAVTWYIAGALFFALGPSLVVTFFLAGIVTFGGPRNPAEGMQPFELLPEQAVDLTLVWNWGGEPYGALNVGKWRFAMQLPQ